MKHLFSSFDKDPKRFIAWSVVLVTFSLSIAVLQYRVNELYAVSADTQLASTVR
jgi:hypothetical protein